MDTAGSYGLTPAKVGTLGQTRSDCRAVARPTDDRLQAVWQQTSTELARLVCAMGIAPTRAEDLLQDVYLTAWRKHPATDRHDELKRWLFRVTVNRCNLEHRRHTRWRRVLANLARAVQHGGRRRAGCGDAAEAACRNEQRQVVRGALDRLDPPLRSVLVLRYFAEFDSKEIGRILELPDSTVRSRLRAARKKLAQALKDAGYRHD
jgi:RNA polymerase sigma-70 factor (ECF subfamily)